MRAKEVPSPLPLPPPLSPLFLFFDLLLLRRTLLSECLEQANSYFAARFRGIKQKKSSWGSGMNNIFLFFSPQVLEPSNISKSVFTQSLLCCPSI